MNLSKVKRAYKKARRTMFGPAPDMRAITSQALVTDSIDGEYLVQTTRELYGSIGFHLGGREIGIHGKVAINKGGLKNIEANIYREKLARLHKVLTEAYAHLTSKDPASLRLREFLNHDDDDNDYGSSIMVVIPEMGNPHEHCTLEIASCHFKHRQTPSRKELMKVLKFMIKGLELHQFDYENAYLVWKGR